ncbi:LysR family transcriptional regulator [Burkholderia contaminans]|nr:LysR family transcriptional regulator [Burkholderia contaminans]
MRGLLASKLSHTIEFQLTTPRNCDAGDALDAFAAALAEQFGGLDGLSGG